MEVIFHEQQEGSLCAQHCLNALLQGEYFSAVDLAELAQQLDESEREQMAVNGLQTEEYQKFMQQPSSNFDDSGFFSIQVIQKGLSVWGLNLIPYNSQDALAIRARNNPTEMKAYICNFREHWLAIRKLGHQWFNLNSLLTGPELVSDTYLSLFLTQLQQEGYSVFIVLGSLPDCEADQLLQLMPVTQPVKPRLLRDDGDDEQPSHKNKQETSSKTTKSVDSTNDKDVIPPSQEEVRAKRLAFLSKLDNSSRPENTNNSEGTSSSEPKSVDNNEDGESEEAMLQRALAMSMETS